MNSPRPWAPAVAALVVLGHACLPAAPPFPEHLYSLDAETTVDVDAGEVSDTADTPVPGPDVAPEVSAPACALLRDGACLTVTHLALGTDHACAALSDATVRCWGADDHLQLGPAGGVALGERTIVDLDAGDGFTCVVTVAPPPGRFDDEPREVRCWGRGDEGQLGPDVDADTRDPVLVPLDPGDDPNKIALGGATACAGMITGEERCWGRVLGPAGGQSGPSEIPGDGPKTPSSLSLGDAHACGNLGQLSCWGANDRGQLGAGAGEGSATPLQVDSSIHFSKSLAAGGAHTCVITPDSQVLCWGAGDRGQLGTSDLQDAATPTAPELSLDVPNGVLGAATAGRAHTCLSLRPSEWVCFGDNTAGQLGDPDLGERAWKPNDLLPTAYLHLAAGGDSTCGVREADEQLECWGELGTAGSVPAVVDLGAH